jgi:hypothetical protein
VGARKGGGQAAVWVGQYCRCSEEEDGYKGKQEKDKKNKGCA